jgi:hypothetical protein
MIEYVISSLLLNIGLGAYLFYNNMYVPKNYKKVIIIEEKNGARQIKMDYAKERKGNTITLLKRKTNLQYDTESKTEDGSKVDVEFIDNVGKPVLFLRTNGEKYTYCTYKGNEITGLTKDQRIWFADQAERVNKQYTLDNALSKFLGTYGRDIIWGLVLIGSIIACLKFAGQPSEGFINSFGNAIQSLKEAVLSLGGQIDKIGVGGSPGI